MNIVLRPFVCFSLILSFGACKSSDSRELSRMPSSEAPPRILQIKPVLKSLLNVYDFRAERVVIDGEIAKSGFRNWSECFVEGYGRAPIKQDEEGRILKICQPDTLYSWQSDHGFKSFEHDLSVANKSSFSRKQLFTHVNPVSTFPYGNFPVRMKLKSEVGFKVILNVHSEDVKDGNYCSLLSPTEMLNTVLVRVIDIGTDYILCSPKVINSWSVFTKRHYDEIVVSTLWYFYRSEKYDWLPYREPIPPKLSGQVSSLFITDEMPKNDQGMPFKFDGHEYSQVQLAENLSFYRLQVEDGKGGIHSAHNRPAKPEHHFRTANPIYWNTNE